MRVRETKPKYLEQFEGDEEKIIEAALAILESRVCNGDAMTDPATVGRYFTTRLAGNQNEVFAALFLDTRHRALAYEELFHGTVDGAEVHPREIVKTALRYNAAAVVVAHNHPSGNIEPSAADRAVTAQLKAALKLVDIRLLDHFVVGGGRATSLAARGWV